MGRGRRGGIGEGGKSKKGGGGEKLCTLVLVQVLPTLHLWSDCLDHLSQQVYYCGDQFLTLKKL
jgi:hypothetical protein